MSRVAGFLIVLLGCIAATVAPCEAQTRRALLVGINNYRNVDPLQKAVGDVTAMKAALEKLGFSVDLVADPDRRALNVAVSNFAAKIKKGDIAFVQFSGHGVALDGENYLLPSDIPKPGTSDKDLLKSESLALSSLLERIRAPGPLATIFVIDACRDNPFANAGTRSIGTRGGLANIEAGRGAGGVFIMYSAGYGQTAVDRLSDTDPEPTSVYTRTLLRKISVEGTPITGLAREVREDVEALAASIHHDQRPAYYDELSGPMFYFAPPHGGIAEVASAAPGVVVSPRVAAPTPPQAAVVVTPSFDCRFAKTSDEIAVCGNARLASLDRTLSQVFYAKIDVLGDEQRKALRKEQNGWLAQRRNCADNVACIDQAYSSRIATLQGQYAPAAVPVAASPSFNCAYAKTPDEIAICGNGMLAAKDRQLSTLYSRAKQAYGSNPQFIASQRAWISQRNLCLNSVSCIAAVYDGRIQLLARLSN